MIQCRDFIETATGFDNTKHPCIDWSTDNKKLLVKAHERYVYEYSDHLIMTKIHRDNNGEYPFSKLDFLSHKLQEIVFPFITPVLYAADFSDKACPSFLIERIELDEGHKAYNKLHQKEKKNSGFDYFYDLSFLRTDSEPKKLSDGHINFCAKVRADYSGSLEKYGIAFDYATVNLTKSNGTPVAIEMHKCLRPYLFDFNRCKLYFENEHKNREEASQALLILERINEICKFLN